MFVWKHSDIAKPEQKMKDTQTPHQGLGIMED